MKNEYIPQLTLNFIWNENDANQVKPIIDATRNRFARDRDKPFSRGLNIPLFFFSARHPNEVPSAYPEALAKSNLIFVFTSKNTLGRKKWKDYVEGIPSSSSIHIVPIAIDSMGLGHGGALSGINCIRALDWPAENKDFYAAVFLAHEIYRFGFTETTDVGLNRSIKIFLSHAKLGDTGKLHSERIKRFIDNSNMNRFFDANEISPGYQFGREIEKHIEKSTLIAIESDIYSSRYWCQKELLVAKKSGRPIVVVNCLAEYEDRIFPAASNVPCVHVSSNDPLSEKDILRILASSIIETVRYHYSLSCLEEYKRIGWIENDCELLARPPEIRQVLHLRENIQKICYPEPPIYPDEADWLESLQINAFTPLWNPFEQDCLLNLKIGISISEVVDEGYSDLHLHLDHLYRLAQDLARHLLARSATLLYGGDLRPDGFTEFILDEAKILKERMSDAKPVVENHLAWPLYVPDEEITEWRATYHDVMSTIEHDIPSDIADMVNEKVFLNANSPEDYYIWSRCLSEMRKSSIFSSHVRICAGGKTSGYKGKMPGVLEEIVFAINAGKPLYLLGAFGGVVGDVCKVILGSETPDTFTESWQVSENEKYEEVQAIARSHGQDSDYRLIVDNIRSVSLIELSNQCGLNEAEYRRLMASPFIDECIHLIIKGLKHKRFE